MDLISNKPDVAAGGRHGVVVSILAGSVVDKPTAVDDQVCILHHQYQNAGSGVDGAVVDEAAASYDDAAERTDDRQCPFVTDELASIYEHSSRAGHVTSTNLLCLHPQSRFQQVSDTLLPRRVNLYTGRLQFYRVMPYSANYAVVKCLYVRPSVTH